MGQNFVSYFVRFLGNGVSRKRLLRFTDLQLHFKLVYGSFGQSNRLSTLDFGHRPAKQQRNIPIYDRIWELTVLICILWNKVSAGREVHKRNLRTHQKADLDRKRKKYIPYAQSLSCLNLEQIQNSKSCVCWPRNT